VPEGWFRGTFETAFPAASADGFTFRIRVEGRWRRRLRRQQDPASAAASYATDEVIRLAAACSILAAAALESKANAHLGRPAKLARLGVRMQWARVHVGATLEDQHEAETRMRIRARARSDRDDTRLRIAQAVELRDLLREDPTLVLAHLLLESPATATEAVGAIEKIGEQVAAYAPGASWVKTARLLEKFFEGLPLDAKKLIIDRFCLILTEFGAEDAAQAIMSTHEVLAPRAPSE